MQPTPVFLPGESQGWGSPVSCRLQGRKELDTTEVTQQQQQQSSRKSPNLVLLGECVISSVLSHHSKNLRQWTSVTAWLQFSFIWQAKENTSSKCEGRPTQKNIEAQSWLLFLYVVFFLLLLLLLSLFFLPPPEPALCKLVSQEGCMFHLKFSLWSSDLPLFHFHGLVPPLSFSHCHFGFLFPIPTT